jgi:hypothetical protein
MRSLLASLCLLAASAAAHADGPAPAPPSSIMIVVAANSPVDNLTVEDVRRIFTSGSLELRPLNLPPGTPERVGLDLALLRRGPDEVARYWIERKIRGQSGPPRVIPSGRLVVKIVARVPGAIGYVAEGPLPPDVKAVRVGGLPPGHPRYPFRVQRTP